MTIKWENYNVVCTALGNQLVIAKVNQSGKYPTISDKSTDRTKEIVGAVYQHMQAAYERVKADDNKAVGLTFTFQDGGKLVYEPAEKVREDI